MDGAGTPVEGGVDASTWVARVIGVSQSYGEAVALDDVTLDIPAGKMIGLIGPDGVGKSTLLGMLAGPSVSLIARP